MYRPAVVVMDYETALLDGTPSVEYYRKDFRVVSAAFAWRGEDGTLKTLCLEGEHEIEIFLKHIANHAVPIVVHNLQFEFGVSLYRFPFICPFIQIDTMRLTQVADNGGKWEHVAVKLQTYDDLLDSVENGEEDKPHLTGLSLVAAASRFLPEDKQQHKEPFHKWLRDNKGVKKGQEGSNLMSLPTDMLHAYNVADAEITLLLYEALMRKFAEENYDYRLDHSLYSSSARFMAEAKGIGIKVNSAALEQYTREIETEVAGIESNFRQFFAKEIETIETRAGETWVMALKTEKGRARRRAELAADPSIIRFNVGSGKQLAHLFKDILGIEPKFWTKEPKLKPGKTRKKPFVPSPSFKSAHLSTYGEGGELLIKRRKRLLVLKQAQALIKLAVHDGRWHFNIRACGTATGRFAGGHVA